MKLYVSYEGRIDRALDDLIERAVGTGCDGSGGGFGGRDIDFTVSRARRPAIYWRLQAIARCFPINWIFD